MAATLDRDEDRDEDRDWEAERRRNNPNNEPMGHFTGRCRRCGSNDLWDDNLAYGCNKCHALLGTN